MPLSVYDRLSLVAWYGSLCQGNFYASAMYDHTRRGKTAAPYWDVVKEMHLKHLERRYRRPSLRGVESIGIDEFAVRRGHVYKTIVVDLISGRILHAGDGKGAGALDEFWKRVRKEGVSIRYVATDMSSAFAKSVRENVPDAIYVFDHFHVIKLMNDTLDKIRRELVS